MEIIQGIFTALEMSLSMLWEMLWALVLGFLLSAIVQTFVSRRKVASTLGRNSVGSVAVASALGAASSSCSYAAVAIARTLFCKGATLANAIIFEFASTNLVLELGVVIFVVLGWRFLAAQYLGGIFMVIFLALLFRFSLKPALEQQALDQAKKMVPGAMEGHADMDMSLEGGSLASRIFSSRALTAVSQYFYMDAVGVLPDLTLGLILAGVVAAFVPEHMWQSLFLTNSPQLAFVWGPFIGPLIAMASFVCSIGNVPLALVLWNGGISFGGVISFIFADLLIIPILDIYQKYYGTKAANYLFAVSYASIALAGMLVELVFSWLGILPVHQPVAALHMPQPTVSYASFTAIANIIAASIMLLVTWRFVRTGGLKMLKYMYSPSSASAHSHPHDSHHHDAP